MHLFLLAVLSTASAIVLKSGTTIDFPPWTCTDTKHALPGQAPQTITLKTKDLVKIIPAAVFVGPGPWTFKGNLVEFDVTFLYDETSKPPVARITLVEWNAV